MAHVTLSRKAPPFTLEDYQGRPVSLADFEGDRHVVLVFNRGFT